MKIRTVLLWHLGAVLFVGAAGAGTYHGLQILHAQQAAAIAEATPLPTPNPPAEVASEAVAAPPAAVPAAPVKAAPARTLASALPVPPLPRTAPVTHVAARSHKVTRLAVAARRRVYVSAPEAQEPPAAYGYPGYLAYAPPPNYYGYYPRYQYYYGAY